jgi:hypothetical protein
VGLSYVGDAEAAAATVNLPAFTAGDVAVVFAYRNNNATAPSLPAGWTGLQNGGANTNSFRTGYRILVGGDTTTGTWTNATHIQVIILRGNNPTVPYGALAQANGAGNTLTAPALSLQHTDGTSWVIAFAGSKATDANTKTLAGTTDEASTQGALNLATGRAVSSWAGGNYSATVNASGNEMAVVEILASGSYVRATQAYMEVVYKPSGTKVRATQAYMEVVYKELYIDMRSASAAGSSSATAAMRGNLIGQADGSSSGLGVLTVTGAGGGERTYVVWVG